MDMVASSCPLASGKIQARRQRRALTDGYIRCDREAGRGINELKAAIAGNGDMEEELGDLLFTAVNISRFIGCDPEEALHKSSDNCPTL